MTPQAPARSTVAELRQAIEALVQALEPGGPSDARRQAIDHLLADNRYQGEATAPGWVVGMLGDVREKCWGDWQPLEIGPDDPYVLDLVQELPAAVPVEFTNNEESWILHFGPLGTDAVLSFEAQAWRVVKAGDDWSS